MNPWLRLAIAWLAALVAIVLFIRGATRNRDGKYDLPNDPNRFWHQ
jgi:hypothetical protein